ncbi:MAG: sugar transferase [Coriobacteriia bacterium]|nr:sugar transferase [Coriobacteriia bacterium]
MSRKLFVILSLLSDALCVLVGATLAFFIRFAGDTPDANFDALIFAAPFMVLAYLLAGWAFDLYRPSRTDTAFAVVRATALTTFFGALLTAVVLYFGGPITAPFARLTYLLGVALIFTFITLWRMAFLRWGTISWPEQRILMLGTNHMALELACELSKYRKTCWSIVGFVEMGDADVQVTHKLEAFAPIRGNFMQLAHIVDETCANRIIVVSPVDSREIIEQIALAQAHPVTIDLVPDVYEILLARPTSIVGDIPLVRLRQGELPGYRRVAKRILDYMLAVVLTLLMWPIALIAAIAILLESGAPVLYRQERVGRGERHFEVLKFRTMYRGAEVQTGPTLAEKSDPRITRVGRILRKVRIDELPQVVNVFAGQMSFIGPRPERPYFVTEYLRTVPGYDERFRVLPGITGLAQVNGGYATTPELKLKYDLMYVYHQSLLLDLQIITETLRVVLTGHGAR